VSQDLASILHERARLGQMRWPYGLGLSLAFHGLVVGILVLAARRPAEAVPEVKVTWVSLPGMGGVSGGAAAMEEGTQGERQRRVEEVAPQNDAPRTGPTPDTWGSQARNPAKGTSANPLSTGTAPVAAKGKNPNPNTSRGAAGEGGGSGIGVGSGIPGLRASGGVQGGTGLVGELDSNFPFVWYVQNVQNTITGNWNRLTNVQGRVQIYFRIRRDGSLEGVRVEIPSGNAMLDQSALLAVRRSDPLPRLPDGFEGKSLGIRFWFSYLGN